MFMYKILRAVRFWDLVALGTKHSVHVLQLNLDGRCAITLSL